MSDLSGQSDPTLEEKISKSRKYQIGIVLVIAVLFGFRDPIHALAVVYGGAVSLIVSWTLSKGVIKATEVAANDPSKAMGILYIGAVIRFFLVLVLFAIGIGWLGLNPIPLIVAAIAAWLTGVLTART